MSWKVLDRRVIYQGRYLGVVQETCQLPSGEIVDWNIAEIPDWAMVIAFTKDRQVVMEKSYRHVVGAEMWEVPAGYIDPGEEPAAAAQREFEEETGLEVTDLEPIGCWYVLAGKTRCRCHAFVGELGKGRKDLHREVGEQLAVELVPARKVLQMAKEGALNSAPYVAGILMAKELRPDLFA